MEATTKAKTNHSVSLETPVAEKIDQCAGALGLNRSRYYEAALLAFNDRVGRGPLVIYTAALDADKVSAAAMLAAEEGMGLSEYIERLIDRAIATV